MSDYLKLPQIKQLDSGLRDQSFLSANSGFSVCLLGVIRSGKSSALINFISKKPKKGENGFSWYNKFDRIFIFSPSQDDKFKKMLDTKFLRGKKKPNDHPEFIFNGYPGVDEFNTVVDFIEETKDQKSLILIDDCLPAFKKDKRFMNICQRLAHLNCCMLSSFHSFKSIHPLFRANVSMWGIWPLSTGNCRVLYEEIPTGFDRFADFMSAAKFCWRKEFNFMFIKVKGLAAYSWNDSLCLTDL